jgi:hypothetical protein
MNSNAFRYRRRADLDTSARNGARTASWGVVSWVWVCEEISCEIYYYDGSG